MLDTLPDEPNPPYIRAFENVSSVEDKIKKSVDIKMLKCLRGRRSLISLLLFHLLLSHP